MKKKYLFVTTSRADYSQSKNLIKLFKKKTKNFQLLVTGSHLSKRFGYTLSEIICDGIKPDYKIDILKIKNKHIKDINKISENTFKKFNEFFQRKFKPDILIILGDRFEMLPIVYSAYLKNIKIAHINGGELTKGSIDDSIRHAITKLSYFHFASTEKNRLRLIKLGEHPDRVYNFGYLGVEALKQTNFLNKKYLSKQLNIKFNKKNLVLAFHPETFESKKTNINYAKILIKTLKKIKDMNLFITASNFDMAGEEINDIFYKESKINKNIYFFNSLGKDYFFSLLKVSDGIIGNSSSGIIEVPSLKKCTINLGLRQESRSENKSIINSNISRKNIISSIKKMHSIKFKKKIINCSNEYEKKNTSKKILDILLKAEVKGSNKKGFYNG